MHSLAGARPRLAPSAVYQPALAIAALLTAAYLAARPTPLNIGVITCAAALLATLRWPPIGLVALLIAAQTIPWRLNTGTESPLNAALLWLTVLLGIWLVTMLSRRDLRLGPRAVVLPLLCLGATALLALILGSRTWLAFAQNAPLRAQAGGLAIFLWAIGAFLLVANQVRTEAWLRRLTWSFVVLSGLYVLTVLMPVGPLYTALRPIAGPGSQGSLFWTWLAAIAFSQAAYNRSLRPPWRLLLAAVVAGSFYISLVLSGEWLSGWIPALVAVLVTLWSGSPRIALPITIVGGALTALNWNAVFAFLSRGDNTASLTVREDFWEHLTHVFLLDPILGTGFGNYSWYMVLFPTSTSAFGYLKISSHNNYAELLLQTGVVGLLCFGLFVFAIGRLAWRLRPVRPGSFLNAYVHGAIGGLAGMLAASALGDWVLPYVYNVGWNGFRSSLLGWMFLGGVVVVDNIVRRDDATAASGDSS